MNGLIDDLLATCDKIIDELAKFYDNTSETVLINSNNKKETCKMGNYYYILHTFLVFVRKHIVVGNRYYLLLLHKILVKTLVKIKRYITISII